MFHAQVDSLNKALRLQTMRVEDRLLGQIRPVTLVTVTQRLREEEVCYLCYSQGKLYLSVT